MMVPQLEAGSKDGFKRSPMQAGAKVEDQNFAVSDFFISSCFAQWFHLAVQGPSLGTNPTTAWHLTTVGRKMKSGFLRYGARRLGGFRAVSRITCSWLQGEAKSV